MDKEKKIEEKKLRSYQEQKNANKEHNKLAILKYNEKYN